jgi:hypothetical protein
VDVNVFNAYRTNANIRFLRSFFARLVSFDPLYDPKAKTVMTATVAVLMIS